MSREQTQNKIYFNANISLRQQRKYHLLPKLFNIGSLQQMFKMSAVCRNTSTETLTPLLDSVVDDALVHALPLLSDAPPQLIQSPDILSVECRRVPGARPIHDSLPDLDPDC